MSINPIVPSPILPAGTSTIVGTTIRGENPTGPLSDAEHATLKEYAKKLRKLCIHFRKDIDVEDRFRKFKEAFSELTDRNQTSKHPVFRKCSTERLQFFVKEVLEHRNQNGKLLIHFACQLCPKIEIVRFLVVEHGCDINVSTIRGHTPLVFACGRGRDETVKFLLSQKANVLVKTVCGDSAIDMGHGRLKEETMSLLLEEEKKQLHENNGIYKDFRNDPSAIEAQKEHVKTCKHCRSDIAGWKDLLFKEDDIEGYEQFCKEIQLINRKYERERGIESDSEAHTERHGGFFLGNDHGRENYGRETPMDEETPIGGNNGIALRGFGEQRAGLSGEDFAGAKQLFKGIKSILTKEYPLTTQLSKSDFSDKLRRILIDLVMTTNDVLKKSLQAVKKVYKNFVYLFRHVEEIDFQEGVIGDSKALLFLLFDLLSEEQKMATIFNKEYGIKDRRPLRLLIEGLLASMECKLKDLNPTWQRNTIAKGIVDPNLLFHSSKTPGIANGVASAHDDILAQTASRRASQAASRRASRRASQISENTQKTDPSNGSTPSNHTIAPIETGTKESLIHYFYPQEPGNPYASTQTPQKSTPTPQKDEWGTQNGMPVAKECIGCDDVDKNLQPEQEVVENMNREIHTTNIYTALHIFTADELLEHFFENPRPRKVSLFCEIMFLKVVSPVGKFLNDDKEYDERSSICCKTRESILKLWKAHIQFERDSCLLVMPSKEEPIGTEDVSGLQLSINASEETGKESSSAESDTTKTPNKRNLHDGIFDANINDAPSHHNNSSSHNNVSQSQSTCNSPSTTSKRSRSPKKRRVKMNPSYYVPEVAQVVLKSKQLRQSGGPAVMWWLHTACNFKNMVKRCDESIDHVLHNTTTENTIIPDLVSLLIATGKSDSMLTGLYSVSSVISMKAEKNRKSFFLTRTPLESATFKWFENAEFNTDNWNSLWEEILQRDPESFDRYYRHSAYRQGKGNKTNGVSNGNGASSLTTANAIGVDIVTKIQKASKTTDTIKDSVKDNKDIKEELEPCRLISSYELVDSIDKLDRFTQILEGILLNTTKKKTPLAVDAEWGYDIYNLRDTSQKTSSEKTPGKEPLCLLKTLQISIEDTRRGNDEVSDTKQQEYLNIVIDTDLALCMTALCTMKQRVGGLSTSSSSSEQFGELTPYGEKIKALLEYLFPFLKQKDEKKLASDKNSNFFILGFAFHHDIEKLQELYEILASGVISCVISSYGKPNNNGITDWAFIDLQRDPRLRDYQFLKKKEWNSLQSVVKIVLKKHLDKTEQRSEWGQRPLTKSQLDYAALDSEILLQVWMELGGNN